MKKTFTIIILFLVCAGVFGDEVKSVSVMAGDSVTLQTDITKLQEDEMILWRFGEGKSKDLLVEMTTNKIWYTGEKFINKLNISDTQTGDLTIKNMKMKYSGLYEAEINLGTETVYKNFNVTVFKSPSVINDGPSEVASFTVTEGESLTLSCNVQTQTDDLIQWIFGDESVLIAEFDMEDNKTSVYDGADGSFKDRLKLIDQTGDLTITDCKTKHTGVYQLKIIRNKQTLYKIFSVTVIESGLLLGVIAGLCVFFLLVIAAVIAASLILYRHKISELKLKAQENLQIQQNSVTYKDHENIQKPQNSDVDVIDEVKSVSVNGDQAVTDTVNENTQKTQKSVTYTVDKNTQKQQDSVCAADINEEMIRTVQVGGSVTLDTCVTKIQRDDEILWMFGDMTIAEYTGGTDKPTLNKTDERFKDKLEMNLQTGDLTIKNFTSEQAGVYKVQIKNSSGNKEKKFIFAYSVKAQENLQIQQNSVTYKDHENIQKQQNSDVDVIDEVKSVSVKGDQAVTHTVKENTQKTQKSVTYTVDKNIQKQQNSVSDDVINDEMIRTGKVGESVTLDTCVTEIQRDDEIKWMFGDMTIAEYTGGTNKSTLYKIDERFKYSLEMNYQTGDLTIRNFRPELTGVYKVKIKNSSGNKERKFIVAFSVQPTKEFVILSTKVKINEGDAVTWTSEDKCSLVTGMNGDDSKTLYTDDERFRDRLKMNAQTGDLTITDIRQTDEGIYTLKLTKADGKITYRIFNVDVTDSACVRDEAVPLLDKANISSTSMV